MNDSKKRVILGEGPCEVRFDAHTRRLYATDASLYQIEPFGVAFPKNGEEVAWLVGAANEADIPLIPRGAGTGLAGGAVGHGLVVNLAQYNKRIYNLDLDSGTVCVEPGVVLDQLNAFLKPHGYCFGPDVATSSRATLGGMIGNNSSGARAPVYGTTADNIVSLDVVLANGTLATVSETGASLTTIRDAVESILRRLPVGFEEHFPRTTIKRMAGYGIDRYLRHGRNLNDLLCGSEGTLALIISAKLKLAKMPSQKGLVLIFFSSVIEALQACVTLSDLHPASVEHIDSALFDQTRGQLAFRPARTLLRLDEEPCEAILIVEFYDDVADRVEAAVRRGLGMRSMKVTDAKEMDMVWGLRKAGLSLLTGRKGAAKPVPGLEDVAVLPEQLPEYAEGVQNIMSEMGLQGSFYGHAGAGLLHIRPIIDCTLPEHIEKYRKMAEKVFALANQFRATIAGEHGVGIARTEFLQEHVGADLYNAMQEIKRLFDPVNRFNPGKIISEDNAAPVYRIDTNWRRGAGYRLELPFKPVLRFRAKDESFLANLEQCNGCGACLKNEPTMCPTFSATGEELMSTRGRANTIRAVLEGFENDKTPWNLSRSLDTALSNCLSCKACTTECPSNVNLSLLKAELLHAKQKQNGLTPRERLVSAVDVMGRLGCMFPRLANWALALPITRHLMEKHLGFAARRPFPTFAQQPFDKWFRRHRPRESNLRGEVFLWDDTFVRYFEPHVGRAAVKVLEAAGFRVSPISGRKCCGRPAFSVGRLDKARALGTHNVQLLLQQKSTTPILFLEPSCHSMFIEDYAELGIPGAEEVANRCVLFEEFLADLLEREPNALQFHPNGNASAAIHAHCHVKALRDPRTAERLLRAILGANVTYLDTGCCGMAGQFGQLREKYDLSVKVAKPLVEKVNRLSDQTAVVACGISCRHQIQHLSSAEPKHIAELLAAWLVPNPDA
ncbi:MAG TPA: FAD-linked oxidase C-terminal domain-containing protein [Candidatus Hydrogenedentes bacterium]|nr:FAD-linked oxidase C-terminal domain-containing protein [Candidatus Hydrogenedentota bacterium]HOL77136.1 FAD-linked oxidase C-terminal domain-containing protein [Candidatus Hydrogenedentota bacterium]HPO86945.1 FAD-linked oxidase C-terminal domain-containing protein [Candidatus Hydrogenedentota bacterium]